MNDNSRKLEEGTGRGEKEGEKEQTNGTQKSISNGTNGKFMYGKKPKQYIRTVNEGYGTS